MVAPVVAGALIGGGASLLGGAFSNSSNAKAVKRQIRYQKEFAQYGIRWRAADARAAGLHPLFAMGAQIPGFQPVYSQDSMGPALSEAGQNLGRAVAAQQTPIERQAAAMQMQLLQSQIGETDARRMLLDSERMRNLQEMNQVQTFPVDTDDFVRQSWDASPMTGSMDESFAVPRGRYEPKAATVISPSRGDSSLVAGDATPLWRSFQFADGRPVVLPGGISGDAAEVLESLAESPILMGIVVKENLKRFGTNSVFYSDKAALWRRPGEWLGGKLADLRDRASRGSYRKPR